MYAVWYPNGYTNPSQKAFSGATIGGYFLVRAEVRPQRGTILSAQVTESILEEVTSDHPVTTSRPAYDQYLDASNNMIVLYIPATLWLYHNSTYRFRITVTYVAMTGAPPDGFETFPPESGELTLNVRNMELRESGSPPPYFVWDPDTMTSKSFHVFLMHAQTGQCTVTLRIYRSENNRQPIATRVYNLWRPDDETLVWDGMVDGDDGDPPTRAEKGIYLYEIEAIAGLRPDGGPDRDSNRSDFLRIDHAYDTQNEPLLYAEYWGYDDRGTLEDETDDEHLYFIRWYVLKDSLNTNAHRGEIWLFDPELQRIGTWDLAQLPCVEHNNQPDGLTASASGVRHGVLVRVPVSLMVTPGEYLFMVHAVDDHVAREKCHRRKPALPLNAQLHMEIDKVRVYYRNLTDRSRAYPFNTDTVALRAIVWVRTRQGYYAFCGMGFRNSSSEWFENDGYWFATGTGGDPIIWSQDSLPRLDPTQRVYRWPGGMLHFSWYRLTHKVDLEQDLSLKRTDFECRCNNRVEHVHRYYYYPPFTRLSIGWGTDALPVALGTSRYAVRVIWWVRGQRCVVASPAPTPGRYQSPNPSPVNWDLTWSQNCDEREEYPVRISVRNGEIDNSWQADPLRRSYLQWLTSCLGVPYEWGGRWYGGKAEDVRGDASGYDNAYNGYGFDCVGVVNAAAKRAGYNWPLEPYTVSALVTETYSIPITWEQREPGDILARAGVHVVTIYRVNGTATNPTDEVLDAHGAAPEGEPQSLYNTTHRCPKNASYWRDRGFRPYRLKSYPQ